MARMQRKYDHEFKVQAVKLAREIGGSKTAKELGVPEGTVHTWLKAARSRQLDIGENSHTPQSAMSLSQELALLRKRVKEQDREFVVFKRKMNSWRQPVLFSQRAVGSQQNRKNEIHCNQD